MATIRQRRRQDGSLRFHVQVRIAGYPSRTASFATRRAAERWATTVEADMIEGRHFRHSEARRRTLAEAVKRYIKEELPKKRDATATRLEWWSVQVGHLKLADITPALIVEKRNQLALSSYRRSKRDRAAEYPRTGATVNRYLSALGKLLATARTEWHWLTHNPMSGVSKLPEGQGRLRFLSDDERGALLTETAKDSKLHLFVLLALSTAARAGELQKLEWQDVDLKAGRLLFRETKNATPRAAWISGPVLELLKAHSKVCRIDSARVFETVRELKSGDRRVYVYRYRAGFEAAAAAAGIKDFTFHGLRHTAATYLAQAGATEQQLKAIGGWKSSVVSRYIHLAGEDSKVAMAKLAKRVSA